MSRRTSNLSAGLIKMNSQKLQQQDRFHWRKCVLPVNSLSPIVPGESSHHCALVDAPFSDRHLRLQLCRTPYETDPETAKQNWNPLS